MACNFKETILKLLSATGYSLDLTEDQISSFENLKDLKPLFQWLSQSLSEANCITPEELEQFEKLQEQGRVIYEEELDEAIQSHLNKDGSSPVPFKEALNDTEEELGLLKEQLHYKKVLHQELCSLNVAMDNEIQELNRKQRKADDKQKEVIKNIYATSKTFKDEVTKIQNDFDELRDDVIELAGSAEVSLDEGIDSLASDAVSNRSFTGSVWSLSTASSWQTIKGKDMKTSKYMCQLSYDKYKRIHKQFSKRLTKLLDNLSKVGKSQASNVDYKDLQLAQDRLEKQMLLLITTEAELAGIRAARVKVKELYKTEHTEDSLQSALDREDEELGNKLLNQSLELSCGEDLPSACKRWAEFRALQVIECKMRERIEISKGLIEKMDELLDPLLQKLKADKILYEVLCYEKEKVEMSINLYKSFHSSLQNQFDEMEKRIEVLCNNSQDFEQFCALPLESQNDHIKRLASIVLCDNQGVAQAVQELTESSRREHETVLEHYVHEKNKLISSGKNMEELYNKAMSRCTNTETDQSQVVENIQRGLDQIDNAIEEVISDIFEVKQNLIDKTEENGEETRNGIH